MEWEECILDNREQTGLPQSERKKFYTLDEVQEMIEPQSQRDKNTMRQCIAGLTEYAAQLTVQGREGQFPRLRQICIEMAVFWDLTDGDTVPSLQEVEACFGGAFDSAVAAARDSGQAPELSPQAKQNILDGLELYAEEMRINDEELEDWAVECEILAEDLEEQWKLEIAATEQTAPQMDGMNL